MAMHDNAGQICQLKQQLTSWRNEYDQISQRSRQVLKEKKQLRKENDALQATCDEYRAEHSRLVEEKQRLISGSNSLENGSAARLKDENRRLLEDLENLTEEKKVLGRQRGELQREKERLAEQLEQQITINAQLQSDMQAMNRWAGELQKLKEWTHQKCNVNCPSFDLCQKRVLIVGGITRMEAAYRRLIESRGGIFDYHDGYMKKGVKKLQERLKRADMVLCPVSCNSHGACLAVKKLAKKHNKVVHMLSSAGLAAISEAIQEADDVKKGGTVRCTL
jgi:DNA repair exonuclease SbcCD ATPase subunit